MPTGYTADIAKGITFEQYALNCARAFGACMTMRDAPADMPIPDRFEPSDYYQRKLEETRIELNRIVIMSPDEILAACDKDYKRDLESHNNRIREAAELRSKYEAMLSSVRAWIAPTSEHVSLKTFMENQIIESIRFDCDTSYNTFPEHPKPDQWVKVQLARLQRDIAYYEEEHEKEVKRTADCAAWIHALRNSLKGEPS